MIIKKINGETIFRCKKGEFVKSIEARSANLEFANLRSADLRDATYSLFDISQIQLYNISDALCLELMRWDSLAAISDTAMTEWVDGGNCPCPGRNGTVRLFNFEEKKSLWKPGIPEKNIREVWEWIAKEQNIKI